MTDTRPETDAVETEAAVAANATALSETAKKAAAEANDLGEFRSLRSDVWREFRKHKGAMSGVVILIIITLACFVGPVLLPFDVSKPDLTATNRPAGWPHLLGTDNLGRDAFTRALLGGRISLLVGFVAMAISIIVGTLIGAVAGYFKRLDWILMWITDLFLSLPLLPILLVAVVLFRNPMQDWLGDSLGIFVLMVTIIGATSWMQTARIVRGEVLSVKEEEFILASRSIGTRPRRIIMSHIMPNVLSPVIVAASLGIAIAIITESAVSFLGLGFPLEIPTWGSLLNDSVARLSLNVWLTVGPGILLSLTVLSVNLIGDGLRDALDPKGRS